MTKNCVWSAAPEPSWWKRRSRPFKSSSVKSTPQRRRPPRRLPQRIPWQEMVDAMKNLQKDGSLTKEEEMNEALVPWSTYGSFVSAGGVLIFLLVILAQLGGQALNIYANFWLTNWGANTEKFQVTYLRDMPLSRSLYWYRGYAITLIAGVIMVTCRFAPYLSLWTVVLHSCILLCTSTVVHC